MATEMHVGDLVFTADGELLGHVRRVDDVVFMIDVPGGPDYWLKRDEVATVEGESVRLGFDRDSLDERTINYGSWDG